MSTQDPAENAGMPNDYRRTNKLNFILDSSQKALLGAKYAFVDQLSKYVAVEKEYCRKLKTPPQMVGEKYQRVCQLLEMAPDFYWVEALAQFVFDDCIMPTYNELETRARKVKTLSALWLPDRKTSYNYGK